MVEYDLGANTVIQVRTSVPVHLFPETKALSHSNTLVEEGAKQNEAEKYWLNNIKDSTSDNTLYRVETKGSG